MELLERLRQQAGDVPGLKLAVLFGSTARSRAMPGSDVDLGVLLEPYSASARFTAEAKLGRAAQRPIHLILLDEAPPLLRFEIAREGVLLHENEEGLWPGFKAKAMIDWWDWAPTARKMNAEVIRRLKEIVAGGQA
jgi:predicted nucleotidyltransferase